MQVSYALPVCIRPLPRRGAGTAADRRRTPGRVPFAGWQVCGGRAANGRRGGRLTRCRHGRTWSGLIPNGRTRRSTPVGNHEDDMQANLFRAFSTAAFGMTLAILAGPALAQGTGRLDKIRETGAITLGHPETSVPFAFLDGSQKPVGYTVEICERVAQEIKTALKLPKLDIRYNPTTSATRIPLLANGTIDLECGNTTNNLDRHKFVAFAPTTFVPRS